MQRLVSTAVVADHLYDCFLPSHSQVLQQAFGIVRRVPVAGYDLSFVITAQHCWEYSKDSLIDFMCCFIEQSVSATDLKMLVSSRGRAVATSYLRKLTN